MRFLLKAFLLFAVIVAGCSSCRKNHYKVNSSDIKVNIKIKRLEQDLFKLNPEEIISSVPALKLKYKSFLQLFSYVINTGDINESSFGDFLVRYCTDKQNNEVYNLVSKKFPDVKSIENDLNNAFRNYIYYFPERKAPGVFTCITGFNNSIIAGDSVLGISLDRYLGADCEYYPMLEIYKYIAARMTPENIVPDCIYGWGSSDWVLDSMNYSSDNVLTEIIHYGKLKYFEKCMLPELRDDLLFGFNADQMMFCGNNENQMWTYLVEHDLLFSTDQFTIRKITGEAPFTSFFTSESPGRAGIWIGFRIVESYMIKNPGVSLKDLMNDINIQGILEKAKYNPR
jgi:hypothetical protein